jgi:hypothetical protein
MTEEIWKAIGRPNMTPSLEGIGLFRGKMVNLCGNLTQISMNAHGALTKEHLRLLSSWRTTPLLLCYFVNLGLRKIKLENRKQKRT